MADAEPEPSSSSSPSPSPCFSLEPINNGLETLTLEETPRDEPEEAREEEHTGSEEDNGSPDDEVEEEEENGEDPGKAKEGKGKGKRFRYPARLDKPDCTYYLKTGACRFGSNCRFNHPGRRKKNLGKPKDSSENKRNVREKESETDKETLAEKVEQENSKIVKEKEKGTEKKTLPDKVGQAKCKFYLMPGGCKFGQECKFVHDDEMNKEDPVELNFLGLPMRPGEKECPYYMRTGGCKYASNCRFHHPDPTISEIGGNLPSRYTKGHSSGVSQLPPSTSSWPLHMTPSEPVPFFNALPPFVPGIFLPPQGLPPALEWTGYQAPVNPFYPPPLDLVLQHSSLNINYHKSKTPGFVHQAYNTDQYPERPGQPDCQYFMKTGSCKFKSSCRFHHPKDRSAKALLHAA